VEMVQISKDLEVFDAELVALSQMTCLLHKTKLIQLKRSIDITRLFNVPILLQCYIIDI